MRDVLEASLPGVGADWRRLTLATVCFGLGFGIYQATAPVYATSGLGLAREQLGLLEGLREIPGLLTALMMALAVGIALPRLGGGALAIAGAGFAATGLAGGFGPLVAASILWSVGLHVWLTVQPSLILSMTREGRHGLGLGVMNRAQAVAILAGLGIVTLLSGGRDPSGLLPGFAGTLLLAGTLTAVGGLAVARVACSGSDTGPRPTLILRRRYWRYYLLTLLDGGRRQVVQTFAVLILIKEYAVGVKTVALLLLINNLLTMAAAPVVGSWTDRWGERRVLTLYYTFVALVFAGYTQVPFIASYTGQPDAWIFAGIYCLDNLLFTGSVGIQTYIRHTADRGDLSASLAMGLTWNHVAAVTVPIAAGHVWADFGYQTIFAGGVLLAMVSIATSLALPRRAGPVAA